MAEADFAAALEAATRLGQSIGEELVALGIDIDCAPCLDVRRPETTEAIGDRAFAADPRLVGYLGRAMAEGLLGLRACCRSSSICRVMAVPSSTAISSFPW